MKKINNMKTEIEKLSEIFDEDNFEQEMDYKGLDAQYFIRLLEGSIEQLTEPEERVLALGVRDIKNGIRAQYPNNEDLDWSSVKSIIDENIMKYSDYTEEEKNEIEEYIKEEFRSNAVNLR